MTAVAGADGQAEARGAARSAEGNLILTADEKGVEWRGRGASSMERTRASSSPVPPWLGAT